MVESPISGNKDPSSVEGGYKYIPIGTPKRPRRWDINA